MQQSHLMIEHLISDLLKAGQYKKALDLCYEHSDRISLRFVMRHTAFHFLLRPQKIFYLFKALAVTRPEYLIVNLLEGKQYDAAVIVARENRGRLDPNAVFNNFPLLNHAAVCARSTLLEELLAYPHLNFRFRPPKGFNVHALHVAVMGGCPQNVAKLIEIGVEVTASVQDHITQIEALDLAAKRLQNSKTDPLQYQDACDIVNILLHNGAAIGRTMPPLMMSEEDIVEGCVFYETIQRPNSPVTNGLALHEKAWFGKELFIDESLFLSTMDNLLQKLKLRWDELDESTWHAKVLPRLEAEGLDPTVYVYEHWLYRRQEQVRKQLIREILHEFSVRSLPTERVDPEAWASIAIPIIVSAGKPKNALKPEDLRIPFAIPTQQILWRCEERLQQQENPEIRKLYRTLNCRLNVSLKQLCIEQLARVVNENESILPIDTRILIHQLRTEPALAGKMQREKTICQERSKQLNMLLDAQFQHGSNMTVYEFFNQWEYIISFMLVAAALCYGIPVSSLLPLLFMLNVVSSTGRAVKEFAKRLFTPMHYWTLVSESYKQELVKVHEAGDDIDWIRMPDGRLDLREICRLRNSYAHHLDLLEDPSNFRLTPTGEIRLPRNPRIHQFFQPAFSHEEQTTLPILPDDSLRVDPEDCRDNSFTRFRGWFFQRVLGVAVAPESSYQGNLLQDLTRRWWH